MPADFQSFVRSWIFKRGPMTVKKILIVDDEAAIVDILGTRLKAAGFEICVASDGAQALEKVKTEKPDLIITDVLMPRMTGFELMRKIRANPESRALPAIVISARGAMRDYFADISGVEFIPKPYEPKELVTRIELLLGGKNVAEAGARRMILLGVEDFLVDKIKVLLASQKWQALTALNEEDVLTMAKSLHPAFVLCQFWEEESVLDAKKLNGKLAEHADLARLPLYVYCKEALSIDAMKTFKGDRLITYTATSDLLKKLELFLKTNAPK